MTRQENKSENPYQVPSAELRPESQGSIEWSDLAIRCAERYVGCLFWGMNFVFYLFFVTKIAIDVFHIFWLDGATLDYDSLTPLILVVFLIESAFVVPSSKLYVYYYRTKRKISVGEFAETHMKQHGWPIQWPSVLTLMLLLIFLIGALFLWGEFPNLFDLETLLQSDRVRLMWVFGLVTPIAYVIMRVATERAKDKLEEMTIEQQR